MSVHPLESLSALLDEELPEAERRDVEAHVAACPSCARHLRELAAVDTLARGLPPAGAPDGYLESLPGRVRRRIRADRPASARAPWVWPLAAGLALAVLAPIVLRQQLSREPADSSGPTVGMEAPAAPPATAAPEPGEAAVPRQSAAAPEAKRRGTESGVAADAVAPARPPSASRAPQGEVAPAPKTRDAFAAPPPAARANESDRGAQDAPAAAGKLTGAPPAAAPLAEEVAVAEVGRLEEERAESAGALAGRRDAAPSLQKAEPQPRAAESRDERRRIQSSGADTEKAFRENAALPASTAAEALRAREAWRRFVALDPTGRRADEGRVRFIEAAVAVFRLTGDQGDRVLAENEARAYLAVPGAPQAARVKESLRRLDDPR